jgi:hypothetical protein
MMTTLVKALGPRVAWQPCEGRRHCHPSTKSTPGAHREALCGKDILIRRLPASHPSWWWPTCEICREEARKLT